MQCHKVNDLLSAYVDGMLDPSIRKKVDLHFGQCPDCRAEFDEFKAVLNLLHELPQLDPPASFRRDLRVRLEQVAGFRRPAGRLHGLVSRGRWPAVAAAAASFLLVIGIAAVWPGISVFNKDKLAGQGSYKAPVETVLDTKEKGEGIDARDIKIDQSSEESVKAPPPEGTERIARDTGVEQPEPDRGDALFSIAMADQTVPPDSFPVTARSEDTSPGRAEALEGRMPGVAAKGAAGTSPAESPAALNKLQKNDKPKQAFVDMKVEQKTAAARDIMDIARKYGGEALVMPNTEGAEIVVKVPGSLLEQAVDDMGKAGRITRWEYWEEAPSLTGPGAQVKMEMQLQKAPEEAGGDEDMATIRVRLL